MTLELREGFGKRNWNGTIDFEGRLVGDSRKVDWRKG